MDFSAAHAGFVYAAYGLSFVLLVGLTLYILGRDRKLAAELEHSRGKDAP